MATGRMTPSMAHRCWTGRNAWIITKGMAGQGGGHGPRSVSHRRSQPSRAAATEGQAAIVAVSALARRP